MGITINQGDLDRITGKLAGFFDGMQPDLKQVGDVAAEAIVSSTLKGVGADDKPFPAYSPAYQALRASLGSDPNTVTLRGAVAPKADPGGARGKRTARPQLGPIDPASEMSLDLIHSEATPNGVTVTYQPRAAAYMLAQQEGTGKLPARRWFTASKTVVRAGVNAALGAILKARAAWFNDRSATAPAPPAGDEVKEAGRRASQVLP